MMLELELVAVVKLVVTLQVGDTVVELEGAGGPWPWPCQDAPISIIGK